MTTEKEIKIIEDSVRIIRERTDFEPEIGMILGSGLGDYADKIENPVKISYPLWRAMRASLYWEPVWGKR